MLIERKHMNDRKIPNTHRRRKCKIDTLYSLSLCTVMYAKSPHGGYMSFSVVGYILF